MQTKLLSVAIGAALLTGCGTLSGGHSEEHHEATSAYISDSSGNAVAHGGGCLRSSGWSKDSASAGCEGEEEKVAEKAPVAPEPVAVATPPPPPPPPPPPVVPAKVEKVVLSGRALFPYDSAALTSQGDEEMGALISKLESYQDIELVDVVGHADSRGSIEYNQALSERRAETVKGKLEESFPQVPITATGLGETAPVASNDTEEGRRLNRRVEIRVEAIN